MLRYQWAEIKTVRDRCFEELFAVLALVFIINSVCHIIFQGCFSHHCWSSRSKVLRLRTFYVLVWLNLTSWDFGGLVIFFYYFLFQLFIINLPLSFFRDPFSNSLSNCRCVCQVYQCHHHLATTTSSVWYSECLTLDESLAATPLWYICKITCPLLFLVTTFQSSFLLNRSQTHLVGHVKTILLASLGLFTNICMLILFAEWKQQT